MANDYPAAHSMDTVWFAVDRDGHVAQFSSGEAGAVPDDAYLGEDYGPVQEALVAAAPGRGFVYVRKGCEPGVAGGPVHQTEKLDAPRGDFLFFVKSAAVADRLEKGNGGRQVRVDEGFGVVLSSPPPDLCKALHGSGDCLACSWFFEPGDEEAPEIARHGVFRFEHRTDNWMAGPYGLAARPEQPLLASALPEDVRKHLVRYDGCFADAPDIQPVEHWASQAWGAAWLSADGRRVAPLPGREKDYAEEWSELEHLSEEGIEVAAPDGPPRTERPEAAAKKPWWKIW